MFFKEKKTINRFVSLLKLELNPQKQESLNNEKKEKTSLYESDVVMLKGVGPKFG